MIAEEYLNRSRLFRRLRNGPHGSYVELYASRLVKLGLTRANAQRRVGRPGYRSGSPRTAQPVSLLANCAIGRPGMKRALQRDVCGPKELFQEILRLIGRLRSEAAHRRTGTRPRHLK
jgi:hypothetical protein